MSKRLFDGTVAALALLLLAPLLAALALWVRLDSPGPALFRQTRVGRHGVPFRIHKFRTMRDGAAGLPLTVGADARITRAGAWLRRTRLDELPQLWDVLRGAMSLVGPRPELPRYVERLPPTLRERVLAVRPGITDPASLAHLDEAARLAAAADPEREYVERILPAKAAIAAAYAEQATLAGDIGVLWRTVLALAGAPTHASEPTPARSDEGTGPASGAAAGGASMSTSAARRVSPAMTGAEAGVDSAADRGTGSGAGAGAGAGAPESGREGLVAPVGIGAGEPVTAAATARPAGGWHRLDHLLTRLRPHRAPLSLAVDAAVIVVAWNLTYLFRLGLDRWLSARPGYDGLVLAAVTGVYLAAFVALRVPQSLWRFAGFDEVGRLTLACALAGAASAAGVVALGLVQVPRTVLSLHPLFVLLGVCAVRVVYRALYEQARLRLGGGIDPARPPRRAVVMGAGAAARLLLAGIEGRGWQVLALLDDDPAKRGARIGGVAVRGPLAAVAEPRVRAGATHVIVALPGARIEQRRRALQLAAGTGLPVVTVPSVDELRTGRSSIERLRDIEPEDLLGREPVQLDETAIHGLLDGRTVLVTGAGGSIGGELCRQVARRGPLRLVLLDHGEFNLYAIEQELAAQWPALALVPLIGDVKDLAQLRAVCRRWRPAVVFHAAAYKHVPLMEGDNAWAALRNNTLGTHHAALAAAEAGAERFVLVSTDKAVNPTNVMGATKRAAELVLASLVAAHPATRFVAVRFGNVLGSSGSVIPKFKEQIAAGGPVTVTHPDIIRYFMTIPEASRLVLQAAAIGASGQVLVLDMGEPVRIVDLARQLIRLAGHTPQEIRIEFTGLRAGEKLYEELLADADATLPTAVAGLRVARLTRHGGDVAPLLALAARAGPAGDGEVRAALAALLPEYVPAAAQARSQAEPEAAAAAAAAAAAVAPAATAVASAGAAAGAATPVRASAGAPPRSSAARGGL